MAEKWKTYDSARTMTNKFNKVVEELNTHDSSIEENQRKTEQSLNNKLTSERTNIVIESPSTADLNKLLGIDNSGR
jgi:hypothetical protein